MLELNSKLRLTSPSRCDNHEEANTPNRRELLCSLQLHACQLTTLTLSSKAHIYMNATKDPSNLPRCPNLEDNSHALYASIQST